MVWLQGYELVAGQGLGKDGRDHNFDGQLLAGGDKCWLLRAKLKDLLAIAAE